MSCALGDLGEVEPAKVLSYCQISFGAGDWEEAQPSFWKADLMLRGGKLSIEYFCGEDEWDFRRVTECSVDADADRVPGVPRDVAHALRFLVLAAAAPGAGSNRGSESQG